jgi:hypothetical protein
LRPDSSSSAVKGSEKKTGSMVVGAASKVMGFALLSPSYVLTTGD